MKTSVPLLDCGRVLSPICDELQETFQRVLQSGRFILGAEVEEFEVELASYCGVRYAIGVSSGSDAILLSLMALGIGPGDEVITTPFTFFATAGCIARLGAKPVFVDVEEDTFNIDADLIEAKINSNTKAIIVVHLFGQAADVSAISAVAARYGIPMVEDAAQSIGARYKGRRVGSFGVAGCFSFYPSKNLAALGDAGAVTTNDSTFAARIRSLRNHGQSAKYHYDSIGGNFRLDELQAGFLRVGLRQLDSSLVSRRDNARFYFDALSERVLLPREAPERFHVYNQFSIQVSFREHLVDVLQKRGIGYDIYYPLGLHLQTCFRYLGYRIGDFPITERLSKRVLAIPIFPGLSIQELALVCEAINAGVM